MKEKKENRNRREWVKNVAIIFLIIMLILTFFSNTIMNYSLPEIATQYMTSDSITAKIRGTGTVEVSDPYVLNATETRKVTSVKVKAGDEVQVGDVLLELEDKESDELVAARKSLQEAEDAYATSILTNAISVATRQKIEAGQLDSLSSMQEKVSTAKNAVDDAEKEIETAQETVNDLNLQVSLMEYTKVDTSKEVTDVNNAQAAVNNANTNVTNAEAAKTNADAAVVTKQTAYDNAASAVKSYNAAKETYDSANAAMSAAQTKRDVAWNNYSTSTETDAQVKAQLESVYLEAEAALSQAQVTLSSAENELKSAESIKNAAGDLGTLANELNQANSNAASASTSYTEAVRVQSNANNTLSVAQTALSNKENSTTITDQVKELNKQLAKANAELSAAQAKKANAEEKLTEVQTSLTQQITLESQYEAIAEAKDEIEKMEKNAVGATITSPVAGTISQIDVTAGGTIQSDTAIATIQPAGKDKTLTISVTNEQAKKVSIGTVAELQNSWYYDDLTIQLTAIRPDTNNPSTNKLLVFNVTGDVSNGESLSISIGDKSSNYDYVVPSSAIREDKEGKFILIVTTKSSPLGNRYYATRANVEVLASDDSKTAVKGDFSDANGVYYGSVYVVTTSSKPINPGDQVRLHE